MIETDGVGVSILFSKPSQSSSDKNFEEEKYIHELTEEEYRHLENKKIVAIDPNMADLIYCIDGIHKDSQIFRYTQNQKRKETKQKKYKDIRQLDKDTVIEGKTFNDKIILTKTVQKWEEEMSLYNKKTLEFDQFTDYIRQKNLMNYMLQPVYQKYIYRKLKLSSYMNLQKTEANMLNRFKKLYGTSDETIVAFGDYEQAQHRQYHEPVKGKGFRSLFRRAGYKTFLVDEFRTSCRCSVEGCAGECIKIRPCYNPRPWKQDLLIMRHGLLKCKTCAKLWNRDTNAARNIYKIAYNAINKEPRPPYLCRSSHRLNQ